MPVTNHNTGINAAVAAELQARRARLRLTQEQVAERSGIPLVTVQRLLAANRAIDVAVLDRLARALDTTVADIMLSAVAHMKD